MKIWTIGTSKRSLEEFLGLLAEHGIEVIADVRRFPTSKFDHFKSEDLKTSLEREGIKYVHIGKLGGYRAGGYKQYMQTKEFQDGMNLLLNLAKSRRTAIMCAELLFFRCHRRYISDRLVELGNSVVHIIDKKRTYQHRIRRVK